MNLINTFRILQFSSVAQSCPTLCDPMDCSPPSSSVHGIPQAKILEWVAILFSNSLFCTVCLSAHFSSVTQPCLTPCDPMDQSTPGFPFHHQLPEFTQIHVHWVDDAIQPSHPLSSPSPPTFHLSQHQGLFKWVSSPQSIGVSASALVLPMNIQDWLLLGWSGWISLLTGLSRVFSNTIVQKHQFFGAQFSLQSNSHIHTWPLEKP